MDSAMEYLKANRVFHIATVDGNKGRVRPFGFTMKRNNTLYLCTGTFKEVYKQMVANPDVEISCTGSDNTWLRIRGRIAFDGSREAKAQAFEESPNLLNMYKKGADDETFTTLYFTEAVATLYSFGKEPKIMPLVIS
jgi:uncharacterized pyridoxamine 5'-phosphate oxidase family protein